MTTLRMRALGMAATLVVSSASASDVPSAITLHHQGHGEILADAKGMTLYTYAPDPKGAAPQCDLACLEDSWTPLRAAKPEVAGSEWATVAREDETLQWSFRGKPLYTYARDVSPGDMYGDEVGQKWYVAVRPRPLPPGFGIAKTPRGQVLIDSRRMSLYVSADDTNACDGVCTRTWKPVEAWWMAVSTIPDWTVVTRRDGTRQWAFKGKPLYRYAADFNPGEASGITVGSWSQVVLEPPPPVPNWVTIQKSDGGELLADAAGKTLYAHNVTKIKAFGIGMASDMETPHLWRPVLAATSDAPIGQWSITSREDGTRQWAFKGMPLYINIRDAEPGELNGIRNTDRVWRTIMASGQTMAGAAN
jgi:predicted lipoprotein with Yx(FWY)xxD motif